MNNRIEQLDSIRGLAALSVLLSHIIIVNMDIFTFVMKTPMRLFTSGYSAVILFFVLSGFVLSLPFLKKDEINYFPYLIKRICRIYIPYLVVIIISVILSNIFYKDNIVGLSDWFNTSWSTLSNTDLIIEHIFLIGNIHSENFNKAIWSLIHELRISLIYPFVVVFIKKLDIKYSLLVCFILSMISGLNNIFHFQISNGLRTSYFDTFNYLSIFIMGTLLAIHRNKIINLYRLLTLSKKWLVLIILLITYNFSNTLVPRILGFHFIEPFLLIIQDYCIAFGAIGFIIIALGSSKIERILMIKPVLFLGKISYSLYLFHLVVLLTCVHLLYSIIPLNLILLMSLGVSIVVSTLSWYLIEKPFIEIGKIITLKILPKKVKLKEGEIYSK
jgi:peptidoglycan/LPS O-acetylase OafA/YrhL